MRLVCFVNNETETSNNITYIHSTGPQDRHAVHYYGTWPTKIQSKCYALLSQILTNDLTSLNLQVKIIQKKINLFNFISVLPNCNES